MIEWWSGVVVRRTRAVLLAGLIFVVAAGVYALGVFDRVSDGGFEDPSSESARAADVQRETLGSRSPDIVAIYSSDDVTVEDPAFRTAVEEVLADLPEELVAGAVPWYAAQDPGMVSEDRRSAQVLISIAGESQDDYMEGYAELAPLLQSETLETDLAGPWAVFDDVNETVSQDLTRAELIALPIVLLLSLLIFGSVVAALMPVLVGLVAVVGALAALRLITLVTDVSVFAVNVVTLIGMGLAIDYALFILSRFREELAAAPETSDGVGAAVRRTMATAGRTVLFSGLVVAASMSSLLVFPQGFLRSIGYGGMTAVLVAMLAALTVLPAGLRLLGRRIDALPVPWAGRARTPVPEGQGAWARIADGVMRRPVAVLVVTTVALVALAAPFLGVRWGGIDHRVLPEDAPSYVASEKLAEDFGEERSAADVVVAGADEAATGEYAAALGEVEGVVAVTPAAAEGDTRLLRVAWTGDSQTPEAQELLRELREVPAPEGAEVLVGGQTAATVDMLGSLADRLPWMAGIVCLIMFVLLFLAFGSVVLPLKAIVMNVLSIGASFGVVTWIFSDGNLEGLLNFDSVGFLDATDPILMLAVLFGLSMDYEVFLLSRVREEWDRSHDNERSVSLGVQRTGRIITSAALLLAIVIGAFATSDIVSMKIIGVGMLVALLLDATVVRALLVPATMKLLGRWNWWAPGPMRRWWERYGFRGH